MTGGTCGHCAGVVVSDPPRPPSAGVGAGGKLTPLCRLKMHPFWALGRGVRGSLDPGSVLVIAFLLGVRVDDARRLAQVGRRARVYVPYGERWFGY